MHVRTHILAAAIAALLLWFGDRQLHRVDLAPLVSGKHIATIKDPTADVALIQAGLRSETTISVFGSSELTSDVDAKIHLFMPKFYNQSAFAFGHAQNQSLAILAELAGSAADVGPRSRIVVLISPSWFATTGLNTQAFFEFVPAPLLASIAFDAKVPSYVKERIGEFLDRRNSEILKPNSLVRYLQYRTESAPKAPVTDALNAAALSADAFFATGLPQFAASRIATWEMALPLWTPPWRPQPLTSRPSIDWNAVKLAGIAAEAAKAQGNAFGVNDFYYQTYVKNELPAVAPTPDLKSPEFDDLTLLVRFLKERQPRVLFVMQPLNALAYKDLSRFQPVRDRVGEIVRGAGFPLLDLWDTVYQPGTLTDIMHLGEYGWQRINEAVANTMIDEAH